MKNSGVLKETQQAELKEGFTFKLGQYWNAKPLVIEIKDSGKSMGSYSWSMADLAKKPIKRNIFVLDPKVPSQTVTVSVELKFPAAP